MTIRDKKNYALGGFLKELRERKGVSLKEVEKATGISNAYLSQLETGARRRLPPPDRLRLIADYYNISVKELLEKAGYYEAKDIKETFAQKINKSFLHVINDPQFNTGQRIDPNTLSIDVKRFVLEMYAYNVRKSSFYISPQAAGRIIDKEIVRSLRWKTEEVTRDTYKAGGKQMIRYRVKVACAETEGEVDTEKVYFEGPKKGTEKVAQTAIGEGVYEEDSAGSQGYEAIMLIKATDIAVRSALPKIKGTNWASIIRPTWSA
ncbi:MAG: helix-turn-helix domain-containing protein [Candidatus Omnitrophica bacterium]|nr:helix-turn-helix domain-containing protein [Candidatus Omnitrophota bacterium]